MHYMQVRDVAKAMWMVRRVTGPGPAGDARAQTQTRTHKFSETMDTLLMLTQVLDGRAVDVVPLPRSRFSFGT